MPRVIDSARSLSLFKRVGLFLALFPVGSVFAALDPNRDQVFAGIETSYYLQNPIKNPALTQSAFSAVNLGLKAERGWLGTQIHVESVGALGLNCSSCTYFEIPELYMNYKADATYSLAFGRKRFSWSKLDQTWQLGLWEPRFVQDVLRPLDVGLLGIHFSFHPSKSFQIYGVISPLYLPERGTQVTFQKNYLIRGDSPWFLPPPSEVMLFGKATAIDYKLAPFNESDIVFNPVFALQTQFGDPTQGNWTTISYAYKPRNQIAALYQPFLRIDSMRAQVNILPEAQSEHMLGLEAGHSSRNTSLWVSMQYQRPVDTKDPPDYIDPTANMRDTFLTGAFASYTLPTTFLHRTILAAGWIHEIDRTNPTAAHSTTPDLASMSSSNYHSDVEGSVEVPFGDFSVKTAYIRGVTTSDAVFSLEASYRPPQPISISLIADFLGASKEDPSPSVWGRFRGNDRILANFSYVF